MFITIEMLILDMDYVEVAKGLMNKTIDELKETTFHNTWLESVFNYMNAGFVLSDPLQEDNPIIHANKKFYEITGYTPEEILGKNCRFMQGEGSDKETLAKVKKDIEDKKPCRHVVLNYRKDGTPFWNELYIAPIFNEAGMLVNYVGIQHELVGKELPE